MIIKKFFESASRSRAANMSSSFFIMNFKSSMTTCLAWYFPLSTLQDQNYCKKEANTFLQIKILPEICVFTWVSKVFVDSFFAKLVHLFQVFHGAESDIIWLQRDFGIYVVNMFDTRKAMKELSYRKYSLQHLIQECCDVVLNKDLQKADWRVRLILTLFIQMLSQLVLFSVTSASFGVLFIHSHCIQLIQWKALQKNICVRPLSNTFRSFSWSPFTIYYVYSSMQKFTCRWIKQYHVRMHA